MGTHQIERIITLNTLYLEFNNKIIIQFGRCSGVDKFTLPMAYTNSKYSVTVIGNSNLSGHTYYITSQSNTTVNFYTNGQLTRWISIGY